MSKQQETSGHERSTSPLELLLDLVFVVGIVQIVGLLLRDHTALGIGRAAIVLGLLWWTWSLYARTTDWTGTEKDTIRLTLLGAMGAALLMARAIPAAFVDGEGLWFAVPFVVLRLAVQGVHWVGAREDDERREGLTTFLPLTGLTPVLVLVGGLLDDPGRSWLWAVAVVVDLAVASVDRGHPSPYYAERNSLFVTVTLGGSLVAIGLRAAREVATVSLVLAVVFTLIGVAALWWAYFDRFAAVGIRHMLSSEADERHRFARDTYTLLHALVVAGIVSFAVGATDIVNHPLRRMDAFERYAFTVGAAVVLLSIGAALYRAERRIPSERLGGAILLVILAAGGSTLSGRVLAGIAVVILVGVTISESSSFRTQPKQAPTRQRGRRRR